MSKTKTDNSKLTELGSLRIAIDKKWTTHDFSILFGSFGSLYEFHSIYEHALHVMEQMEEDDVKYSDDSHTPLRSYLSGLGLSEAFINPSYIYGYTPYSGFTHHFGDRLEVKEVKYSSPGFTDLVGLSGILGHLKDILIHYLPNKLSKEKIKIEEQKRIELQISNLERMGVSQIE